MSLLSSTQGTPERVWSVLKLLEAHGGRMERSEMIAWLNPEFVKDRLARPVTGEPDGQAFGAATSLDFIAREGAGYLLQHTPPARFDLFSDVVHDRLAGSKDDDPDHVVFQAFAWVAVAVERDQSTGVLKTSPADLADSIDRALRGENAVGDKVFNSTKIAAWRRWLQFLGLAVDLPGDGFYPYVAERVWRELERSELPLEQELSPTEVLSVVARRMPYLDGGELFRNLAERSGYRLPARQISRVLSTALRDLDEEGRLELRASGDATGVHHLAPDGLHMKQTVKYIVLRKSDRK